MYIEYPLKIPRPFDDLESVLQSKDYKKSIQFSMYYQDILNKFRFLYIINYRIKDGKYICEKMDLIDKRINESEYSDEDIYSYKYFIGNNFMSAIDSNFLDIESFYIFARILIDRIPYLISDLHTGLLFDNKEYSFKTRIRNYVDFLEKHHDEIKDEMYYKTFLEFFIWFEENLIDIRDHFIVHQNNMHIRNGLTYKNYINVKDVIYYDIKTNIILDDEKTRLILSEDEILKKILEFCDYINNYFIKRLS